jgi:hypothetical protein
MVRVIGLKGKVVGYALAFAAGALFSGSTVFAASTLVQAKKTTSSLAVNGHTVSSAPALTYNGSTYINASSIQSLLSKAGVSEPWNNNRLNVTSLTNGTTTFTVDGSKVATAPQVNYKGTPYVQVPALEKQLAKAGVSPSWDGHKLNVKKPAATPPSIIVKKLPWTYKSKNGMWLTVNSINLTSNQTTLNVTVQNKGQQLGVPSTFIWYLQVGNKNYSITNEDRSFDDALANGVMKPGDHVQGNLYFAALPKGTTQVTLYFQLWAGDNSLDIDVQHVTFDLRK